MGEITKYIRRAKASRATGFALPVIETPEDALRAAREVAAGLGALPEGPRVAFLSDLQELSEALDGRIARLDQEMADSQRKLQQSRFGSQVCRSYVKSASAVAALKAPRRPPCP
jgi:hypothetical protein